MSITIRTTILLLGLGLGAQTPPRDGKALTEALASTKAETVAWAAHEARGLADKSLIVPLQRTLPTWRDDKSPEGRTVLQHVLDALIELHAKMPAAELLPLLDDLSHGTAAFALLAQQPRQNEAELLELFAKLPPATGGQEEEQRLLRTRAIGNLLCAQRTPGFARLAWLQLDLDLHVEVQEPGAPIVTSISFRKRPRSDASPEGFPPASIIRLANRPDPIGSFLQNQPQQKALTLLAHGPLPVYFGRIDADTRNNVTMWASQQSDRAAWLHQLAEPKIREPFRVIQVSGSDAAAYLAAIDSARTKLHTYKETLRRDLVTAKALTEEEASELSTTVEVVVDDQRKDKSKPLPEIPVR